jgi:dienelactone hydrolase
VSAGKDLAFARNGETLRGHLAVPDAPAELPAILLIPDVHGLSDLYREIAGRFAARGFATLAVDLYTRYEQRNATKPRSPLDAAVDLTCPYLGIFGEDDALIPSGDIAELGGRLERAGKTFELKTYAGCGHAFLNHNRPEAYRPEAAVDAFERSVRFFDAHLSPKA